MPPPEEPQPTSEQIEGIIAWIEAGAPWPDEGPRGDPGEQDPEPGLSGEQEHFLASVRPVLEARCFKCHGRPCQAAGTRWPAAGVCAAGRWRTPGSR